ncbi:MAG: P63C domain-containing protein [Dehalococcoidia bacterium]|nr:P63C domain-containing protein [Dehalococcoidia bacterium]
MAKGQQARGGIARAAALSPDKRAEIASQAARTRWNSEENRQMEIPKATHMGELRIMDIILPCAVLDDRTRIITEVSIAGTLGRGAGGKQRRLRKLQAEQRGEVPLPLFLSGATLDPFVSQSLRLALSQPKLYRARGGVRRGIEASLLPEIADVWLKARDAGALQPSQEPIARNADVLMRALAKVAVIALIDEATGYQEVRDRDELNRILEAYINKELLPWSKTFPDEYYRQMFRLKGWQYSPPSVKRPQIVGKLTNDLVYRKLPHGVIEELKRQNPINAAGRRRHKLFQFLTEDIGNPHLKEQLVAVTTLMRAAPTWPAFQRLFGRAFPNEGTQGEFDLGLGQDEE